LCSGFQRLSSIQLTVTKDKQLIPLSDSDLSEEGKQVVGNALRVFTHDTTGVAASRVEVSEESGVVLVASLAILLRLAALGVDVVGDHSLDTELGVAVRVGRAERALFRDGDHVREAGGITVDGCGGREDDVGDVVLGHAAQEAERAEDVDAVVLERDLTRLADSLVRS
jgi:hypothetical protein